MDVEFKCHEMGGMFSSNSWEKPNDMAHSEEKQDMIILFYQQLKLR